MKNKTDILALDLHFFLHSNPRLSIKIRTFAGIYLSSIWLLMSMEFQCLLTLTKDSAWRFGGLFFISALNPLPTYYPRTHMKA